MTDLVGQTFGQFRVVELIGKGGMGDVYRAQDLDAQDFSFEREVALKLLSPQLTADPLFLSRFQYEMKLVALLEHPHILPYYAVGEQNGQPYLVMRYVTGGTMEDRMLGGRVTPDFLARTIGQVAEALDFAHRKGVVHRDVKPSNILLDDHDNAYLGDFGIAKTLVGSAQFTTAGLLVGTPEYMAPEQGRGEDLDGRADVYALACVVFEIVTDSLPYRSQTPMGFMTQHQTSPVPSARKRNKGVSRKLDKLLRQAMAKEREKRPATATEFSRRLIELLEEGGWQQGGQMRDRRPTVRVGPVSEVSPPTPEETPTSPRRRVPVWLLILAGLIVTTGLVALLWNGGPASLVTAAPTATASMTASPTDTIVPSKTPTPPEIPPDTTAPVDPSSISSSSHNIDVWNAADNTIDVEWAGDASDVDGSGLAGYSTMWDNNPISQPDDVVEHTPDILTETSPALADGTWYFHLSTCDQAGNCTSTMHVGPFLLNLTGDEIEASGSQQGSVPEGNVTYETFPVYFCKKAGDGLYQWYEVTVTFNEAGEKIKEDIVDGPFIGEWRGGCPAVDNEGGGGGGNNKKKNKGGGSKGS